MIGPNPGYLLKSFLLLLKILVKNCFTYGYVPEQHTLPQAWKLNNAQVCHSGRNLSHSQGKLSTYSYVHIGKKNLVISIKSFKRCLKDGYFIDWLISKETHETLNMIHWFVPSSSSELIMVILFSLAYLFFNKLIFGRKSSYSKNDFLRVTMLISAC